MYYEKIVGRNIDQCIALSEAFRNSTGSVAQMRDYLVQYRALMDVLRQNLRVPLRKQPQFVWNGVDSACWKFEEHRILHGLRDMLVDEAADLQGKEAQTLLKEAVDVCKEMLCSNETWNKTPFVRAMPVFQPLYLLGLAFRTKAMVCENACAFKASPVVARMAYQFSELSDVCWKRRADPAHTRQLLTAWHHMSAMASDETTQFQARLSHITCARQLSDAPTVQADYETIHEKNTTVYYLSPEPIKCPTLTLAQGMAKL